MKIWFYFPQTDLVEALAFAEQEFGLSERQSDGRSLREHLESVEKQTRTTPKELQDLIELPESMQEYWSWFLRLNSRRPSGMGMSSIPYSEMLAFFELIGVVPDPCEIEVIELFDRTAMKVYSEQQEKEQKSSQSKAKAK